MWGRAVHLYNRWGRIERLVGVKIHIKLTIVVVVELLQLWVDVRLEALSRDIAPFLLIPKYKWPFLNTRKASPNHCMRYIAKPWLKAVRVKLFVRPSGYKDSLMAATVHCRFVCLYYLTPVIERLRAYPLGKCKSLLALPYSKLWLQVSDTSLKAFLLEYSGDRRVRGVESCFSREFGISSSTRPIVRFDKVNQAPARRRVKFEAIFKATMLRS